MAPPVGPGRVQDHRRACRCVAFPHDAPEALLEGKPPRPHTYFPFEVEFVNVKLKVEG
jgi:hypothetical protein